MKRISSRIEHLLRRVDILLILPIFIAAVFFHIWGGFRQELPYITHPDEPVFVRTAVRMAAEGSWNPRKFFHPGSTVFYPLAGVFRLRYSLANRYPLWGPAPGLAADYERNITPFYLLGRGLSVIYGILSVLVVYLVGRKAFGWKTGLLGAWFSILCPLAVYMAHVGRTDSASTFFGLLGLYGCLRLYRCPGWGAQIVAGSFIGLAIATKYSLIPLLGVYALANFFILIEGKRKPLSLAGEFAGGLGSVVLAFLVMTPFFLVELNTALSNIRVEMRPTHLGQDGLSTWGNLGWYLGTVIPNDLGWPRVLLAVGAAVYALANRKPARLLVLFYPLIFLVGISSSSLHWRRWVIPILPVISLLAAWMMVEAAGWFKGETPIGKILKGLLVAMAVIGISYSPARDIVQGNLRRSNPSTRVLARKWVAEHLPAGVVIARENYAIPLHGLPFELLKVSHLPDNSVEEYRAAGAEYFITTSLNYDRYLNEPEIYPDEVDFYRSLFEQGTLLREFSRSSTVSGHTVRIYRWDL